MLSVAQVNFSPRQSPQSATPEYKTNLCLYFVPLLLCLFVPFTPRLVEGGGAVVVGGGGVLSRCRVSVNAHITTTSRRCLPVARVCAINIDFYNRQNPL